MHSNEIYHQFHDSDLIGIKSYDGKAEIAFQNNGITFSISIDEVLCLIVTPFLQGNIVLNYFEGSASKLREMLEGSPSQIKKLFIEYYGKDSFDKYIDNNMIFLSSSYGAEVLCIYNGQLVANYKKIELI
jgi:hypothetical protein